ncbi:MAG: hypothetical protein JRF63_01700 [Deltaproteobacteria bacterium]|nr:hypothetical protein [Deltaproteobacteria bacterium]
MGNKSKTISVPVGLEQLLFTAAKDPVLRAELVRDRNDAAVRRGLELTASERSVLAVAPDDQLEAMIDHIDTSERNLNKRSFMRAVAATAVTLAAGTGLAAGGCSGDKPAPQTDAPFQGQVDTAQVEIEQPEPAPTRGIRPEVDVPEPALNNRGGARPKVDVDDPEPNTKGGARPDIEDDPFASPKLQIEEPEMNLDGGARPDFDEEPTEHKKPKVKIEQPMIKPGGITVDGDKSGQ